MNKETLKKGTRIYYNGDMANEEGLGVIIGQRTDQYGITVDIKMDDGREFYVPITAFSDEYLGHGGTRFVTEEAYTDFRQNQIDKVEATLAKNDAERSIPKKKMYDVWKDETSYQGLKWKVQFVRGIGSFRTKREAVAAAEAWKKADAKARKVRAVSDDELNAMLEDASREAEKRGDPEKPSDHIAEWHQVFNTLYADWDEGRIDDNKILMYMESLARSFIRTLDKKEASKNELRCKACHNWNSEVQFSCAIDGHALMCPNCKTWNKGNIESRPIKRSKSVSVKSIIKGRS